VAKYYESDKDFPIELEPCSMHYEMYDSRRYSCAREVESCMKPFAPISRSTGRTGRETVVEQGQARWSVRKVDTRRRECEPRIRRPLEPS
jgi:hypothetical protein